MQYYTIAAATLAVASASESKAWVEAQLAKYANVPKACAGSDLQASIDDFRAAVEQEPWCNEACTMYFEKGVLYMKAAHSNAEPYSCDLQFNNDLQDKFYYWSANFMDEFPEIEDYYNDFLDENMPECWERVAADFREWEGLDITAKDFYAVAGRQSAEDPNDNTDWSYAADYWYGRRDRTRAFLASQLENCFDNGTNKSFRNFLQDEYKGMFNVLLEFSDEVGAKAASAQGADEDAAEFMWYLNKLLDRASLIGDDYVQGFLKKMPAAAGMLALASPEVGMLQTHWDDFDFNTGKNSLDIVQKLTCDSVLVAAKGAYDALEPLF